MAREVQEKAHAAEKSYRPRPCENPPVNDVTVLLQRWAEGDRDAFESLLPIVYDELRRLARIHMSREQAGHTLQPTDLVHEAYMRLSGVREMQFNNRAHFFGAAAQVMRRVLVDHARKRQAKKRGGGAERVSDFPDQIAGPIDTHLDLEALDEALNALERIAPEKAKVVELRYFGGLSVEETGEFLDLSPATVKRYWSFARAWLHQRLAGAEPAQ
jgi:RNA polymerase sigma factor (TIGR02999 family)